MPRRSDPQRIHEARTAATVERLSSVGTMSRESAERLVAAWEVEAERRGRLRTDGDYWSLAETWIGDQRALGRPIHDSRVSTDQHSTRYET